MILGSSGSRARFREGLATFGWVEGRNLRIDYRFAAGDLSRLAAYAEELVNLRPDVIFALTGPAAAAVQRRTQVIPIVFVGGGSMLGFDLAQRRPRQHRRCLVLREGKLGRPTERGDWLRVGPSLKWGPIDRGQYRLSPTRGLLSDRLLGFLKLKRLPTRYQP